MAKNHRPEDQLCTYSSRLCMQNKLDGYDYCIRHILEDKSAPYKQCNYVYPKNGKRCPNAAAKGDKRDGQVCRNFITYCQDHQKKAALMRLKLSWKYRSVENPETLLEELEYYVGEEGKSNVETRNNDLSAQDISSFGLPAMSCLNQELISDQDSDRELPIVDESWPLDGESEGESVDSEQEDVLKHAVTYTAEEVALLTRDKLIRLQSLYIEQFKRLQHVLREKRRKYLVALKQEKETLGSIHSTPRTSTEVNRHYRRLKAANRYHRRHGQELIMHLREKERRMIAKDGPVNKTSLTCSFVVNGERCKNRSLPLTKFCKTHILNDHHQVLFRPCNVLKTCRRPVVRAVDGSGCVLHASLPPHPTVETKKIVAEDAATAVKSEPIPPPEGATEAGGAQVSDQDKQDLGQELCEELQVVPV